MYKVKTQTSRLGRGLDSLIPGAGSDNEASTSEKVSKLSIDLIDVNPWQPRTDFDPDELSELAQSIRKQGIITPLTVRPIEGGRYQIVAGERRFRASKEVGLTEVPIHIREVSDDQMLALALIENIQRSNLNPIEEARSYQRLIEECQLTQEALSESIGKKRSTIANYLRLLRLPDEIQNGLRQGLLTMGHARAILSIDDEEVQMMLYQQTLEEGYSVHRIEELVREHNEGQSLAAPGPTEPEKPTKKSNTQSTLEQYRVMAEHLSSRFGTKIKFTRAESGKGKITIPFASDEELERIVEILDKVK